MAIVGVGNCANALVQGVDYYREAPTDDSIPGLMNVTMGDYHIGDMQFVAAFDVDSTKVGMDVAKAMWAGLNNTVRFADVGDLGVEVLRGPTLDGLGTHYRDSTEESMSEPVDVVAALREAQADVLVNYLPVGSEEATRFYAAAALEAGVGFVNCIPVFIASDRSWANRFRAAGVPLIGDDIKSKVGATILHRALARLFEERGVDLERTMQLNVGGNMDFKNMLEPIRLDSKKISKTQAVTSQIPYDLGDGNVHIGPSDFVSWLSDRKWAYIRLEGRSFGDVPLNLELKLEVWDSPNSAGVVIDAIRAVQIARDRGMGGPLPGPSAYFMKSPPVQYLDESSREFVVEFIADGAAEEARIVAYLAE